MGAKFLVLLFLAVAAERASAIKCYQCATFAFQGLPNVNKADCADWPNQKYKGTTDCTSTFNTCATVAGKLTGKLSTGVELTVDGTARYCSQVDDADVKCFSGDDAKSFIASSLGLDKSSVSFDGNLCFCKGDNCNGVDAARPLATLLALALAAKHILV